MRCASENEHAEEEDGQSAAVPAQLSLTMLPDDIIVRVLRLLAPDQTLLAVCRRFRAAAHANATAVTLTHDYDPVDDAAHVAIMQRCPCLSRLDTTAVSSELQWPLASLTQLKAMTVPVGWDATNVPTAHVRHVSVRGKVSAPSPLPWAEVADLLYALRGSDAVVHIARLEWRRPSQADAPSQIDASLPSTPATFNAVAPSTAQALVPPNVFVEHLEVQEGAAEAEFETAEELLGVYGAALSRLRALRVLSTLATDLRAYAALLSTLSTLRVEHALQLERLSGLPPAAALQLQELTILNCMSLTTLAALSGSPTLRALHLQLCCALPSLGVTDAGLPALTTLEVVSCTALTTLRAGAGASAPRLRHVRLQNAGRDAASLLREADALTALESLQVNATELSELVVLASLTTPALSRLALGARHLFEECAPTLGALTQLRELAVQSDPRVQDLVWVGAAALARLTALELVHCPGVTSLRGLSGASSLARLLVEDCRWLTSVEGLPADCPRLTTLLLMMCNGLTSVAALPTLPALLELHISGCSALASLSGLATHELGQLDRVEISACKALSDVDDLAVAPRLRSVTLVSLPRLSSLGPLSALRELSVVDCDALTSLGASAALTHIVVRGHERLACLDGVEGARASLRSVSVHGPSTVRLTALACCSHLTDVSISACDELTSLGLLGRMQHLRILWVQACPIATLAGLESASKLGQLSCNDCGQLSRLDGLARAPQLECLHIHRCPRLRSVAGLVTAPKLRKLQITNCWALVSIAALDVANLSCLTHVDLRQCAALADLGGLGSASQLLHLNVNGCRALTELRRVDS